MNILDTWKTYLNRKLNICIEFEQHRLMHRIRSRRGRRWCEKEVGRDTWQMLVKGIGFAVCLKSDRRSEYRGFGCRERWLRVFSSSLQIAIGIWPNYSLRGKTWFPFSKSSHIALNSLHKVLLCSSLLYCYFISSIIYRNQAHVRCWL